MGSGWHLDRIEHTFSTGKKAILRPSPNLIGAFAEVSMEEIEEGRVTEAMIAVDRVHGILRAMFVDPQILDFGEETIDEHRISWNELTPQEIAEALGIWKEAAAKAASFRQKQARARGGANGAGVGRSTKRPARTAAGDGGEPAG